MEREKWQQAKEIFDAALRQKPDSRQKFLNRACAGNETLRGEVESLLSSFGKAESFLETPVVGEMAESLVAEKCQLTSGQNFGRYEIVQQIGSGGMGEVYLATDARLKRPIALKILPAEFTADRERARRFEQEAFAASSLNHPNILTIYEIGEYENTSFIATEFIEGETLRERLRNKPLTINEALDVVAQTASALVAAHEAGIVHRDIKAENIMIRRDRLVKVLDFGLAKLIAVKSNAEAEAETRAQLKTATGVIMGTLAYMSPEQARGTETDARTDVFSLGVVLYEMITGSMPFAGETMSDTIAAILKTEPAPLARFVPDVPRQLERIVGKALRKDREQRYQHIKDLLIDVQDLKQELEFEAKLKRGRFGIPPAVERLDAQETQILEIKPTAENITPESRNTNLLSAEYIAGEIKNHKLGAVAFLVLIIAAAGFGYRFFFNHSSKAKQIESIAVLPFENGSGDANLEYLSDGMTESLISSLSQLPNLNVKARNSVFRYKGKSVEPQQIAKELNVQAILTGRVVERGQDLILYIELVDGATENVLWKSDYNRSTSNLISLQSEIAHDVSSKLKTKLSGADERKLAKNYTENVEAYQLFLKGRYYFEKGTPQDFKKSGDYFGQAIALDPNFALAYAYLSAFYTRSPEPLKAKEAALKAVSLDDQLPTGHIALGDIFEQLEYDLVGAEREYKRALELDPNDASARESYGLMLSSLGKHEEALAELRLAAEIDPLAPGINTSYGNSLLRARRYDEAIAQFKKALELDAYFIPAHYGLAVVYQMQRKYAESVEERAKITEVAIGPQGAAFMRESFASGGWHGFLRAMTGNTQAPKVPPYVLATFYAELGEKDKAFAILNKGNNIVDSSRFI